MWDLLSPVNGGKHVDLVGFDVVNNPKGAFQDLPDLRNPELRYLEAR